MAYPNYVQSQWAQNPYNQIRLVDVPQAQENLNRTLGDVEEFARNQVAQRHLMGMPSLISLGTAALAVPSVQKGIFMLGATPAGRSAQKFLNTPAGKTAGNAVKNFLNLFY